MQKQYVFYCKYMDNPEYMLLSDTNPKFPLMKAIVYDLNTKTYTFINNKAESKIDRVKELSDEFDVMRVYKENFEYNEKKLSEYFDNVKLLVEKGIVKCKKISY